MPNRKLSADALKKWYQKFTKELYEKANIDVTRKEDLGRVKNFVIKEWTEEECSTPDVDCHYVYVPRNGNDYVTPPPDTENFDEYGKWLLDNLQTDAPSIAQIQEMYDMSRDGTLMAYGPLGGFNTMMQIYTDEFGNIETSPPMMAYDAGSGIPIPENKRAPLAPLYVAEPTMETFDFETRPEPPQAPKNMHPGFWSMVGHYLGMHTDYTELKLYEDRKATYPDRLAQWKLDAERLEPQKMHEFRIEQAAREEFEEELYNYKENPIGKATAINDGYRGNAMRLGPEDAEKLHNFWTNEEKFFRKQHSKTTQGAFFNAQQDSKDLLNYAERNKRVVRNLAGPNPNGSDLVEWRGKGILTQDGYKPMNYGIPEHPKGNAATEAEKNDFEKKMNALAEIAGFSAMSDPSVAKGEYEAILQDLFTVGSVGKTEHFSKLEPGRALGMKAFYEYALTNNPDKLAKLIANSVRQTNQVISGLQGMGEHGINTLYLADRLLTVLKNNDDLKAASGLTEDELQETAANVELYHVMRRGAESKIVLLDHALYQKTLTPQQLQQASLDVMFAVYVEDALGVQKKPGHENFSVRDLLNDDWVAQQKANMLEHIKNSKVENMSRENLGATFSYNNQKIRDVLTKPAKVAPTVKQSEPAPAKVLGNSEPYKDGKLFNL